MGNGCSSQQKNQVSDSTIRKEGAEEEKNKEKMNKKEEPKITPQNSQRSTKRTESSHETSSTIFDLSSESGNSSAGSAGQSFFDNTKGKLNAKAHHRVRIEGSREEEETGALSHLVPMTSFLPTHLLKHLVKKEERRSITKGEVFYESEELKEEVCVLFIDISGFTHLTEQLAVHKNGAENLSKIVNRFFKKLINKIIEYGGDIERMAGDALISTFWTKSEGITLTEATNRALLCAYEITQDIKLRKYKVSNKNTLTLHIGLAAGPCNIYHIGGVEDTFWRLCFSDALHELATAIAESDDGEIVITGNTYPIVESYIKARSIVNSENFLFESYLDTPPRKPTITPLEITTVHEDWMRYFIDTHSLEAIDTNQASSEFMSGIKLASIVFVTIQCDSNVMAKSGLSMWDDLMENVQKSVYSYEGVIGNFLNDEKGVLLFCAFGHPKMHVNDPYRAIRCAIEIGEHLKTNPYFKFGIGVTTGKVFLGTCGSHDRRDFSFLGDSVNLAARLMKISFTDHEGSIIADNTTHAKSKVEIAYTQLDPVTVKGKANEILVHRVDGKRDEFEMEVDRQSLMMTPCVRSNLLNHVVDIARNYYQSPYAKAHFDPRETVKSRGFPLITMVDGKSGSGKSHLFSTFAGKVMQNEIDGLAPLNFFMLKPMDLDRNKSFSFFRTWFWSALAIVEYHGGAIRDLSLSMEEWFKLMKMYNSFTSKHKERLIERILDPDDFEHAYALNDIFDTNFPRPENIDKKRLDRCQIQVAKNLLLGAHAYIMFSKESGEVVLESITYRVLRMFVVLEDLQYIDDKSRELFEELFLSTPNVINMTSSMIVSANRELLEGTTLEFINKLDEAATHSFTLMDLTGEEIKQLMIDEANTKGFKVSDVAQDLVTYMTRKSNGNAQIASLFTHKLLENRFIVEQDDLLKIRDVKREEMEDVSLPASVSALVLQRIDNLDPNSKLVIKIASIIGMQFSIERLEDIIPSDMTAATNVPYHVNTLMNQGFVVATDDRTFDGKRLFAFVNQITRDIAYETLLDEQAKSVHGELACRYVDIYMLKRKTKGYSTVDAQDRPLTTAIVLTAQHFAASTATVELTEYTDKALSVIEVVVDYFFERNEDADKPFALLKAYMKILKFREDYDGKKNQMLVKAAANMARKAFILQNRQLDSKTFANAYENVHSGRVAAEELGLVNTTDYFTLVSFEWFNNNNHGRHQENYALLESIKRNEYKEPFQQYIVHAWQCLTSHSLSQFETTMKHYEEAHQLYARHADLIFEKTKEFTFFTQDLGVITNIFASRAAYIKGNHKFSEQIMFDVVSICLRRKDPSTTLFGAIFGFYQLSLVGDLSRYKYFLDLAKKTLDDPAAKSVPNHLFMSVMISIYAAYYPMLDPESTLEVQLEAYNTIKKTLSNPDFDANQIFHVILLSSGAQIVIRLLNMSTFSTECQDCNQNGKDLLVARKIVSELIPLAIKYSHSHQQHIIGLVYMYTGILNLMSFFIDRMYQNLVTYNPCDIAQYSAEEKALFKPLESHSHLEPSAWISRGTSIARKQKALTIELMCLGAKLKYDLVFRCKVNRDQIEDDYNSLSLAWNNLDLNEIQTDLRSMRDVRSILGDAKQILKVYELLILYKGKKIRKNITQIGTLTRFINEIGEIVEAKPKDLSIEYFDPKFNEMIPLTDLTMIPNPCKLTVQHNE